MRVSRSAIGLEQGQYCHHASVEVRLRLKTKADENMGHMLLYRSLAEKEGIGDPSIGLAFGHEGEDLCLTRR